MIFYFISLSTSYRSETVRNFYNQNVSSLELNTKRICACRAKRRSVINVFNSSLTVLPSRLLKNCATLDELSLSDNKIVEIKHDTFENLTDLNRLDLSFNQLITLPKDVFKPLVNLYTLYLQGNQIQIIDSDLFFHNKYLNMLKLNNNNLKLIEPKSFRNNLILDYLEVNDNHNLNNIDLFPENRTNPFFPNFNYLKLSQCGFTYLYIPKHVEKIEANSNKINSITAHPENILKKLSLYGNNLTNLAHMPSLVNLIELDIRKNAMEFIDFNDFSRFKNLLWLSFDLNLNRLNFSAAHIQAILPSISQININSPKISIEQQKQISLDFRRHYIYLTINNDRSLKQYVDDVFEDELEQEMEC